jgi:hypothetical protein
MRLFLKRHSPLFISLAAMLALYIPWLNRGYVNLEFPFQMAARGLSDSQYVMMIDAYWENQANPLGYSILLSWIYRVFGFHEWFWLARVPSLLGICFLIIAGYMMMRQRGEGVSRGFAYWSILLVIHPMVFAFSTAATADILPLGLLFLAVAILSSREKLEYSVALVTAILFSFAIIAKYNSAYFGLVFLFLIFSKFPKSVKIKSKLLVLFVFLVFLLLISYIAWTYLKFDVFVSNRLSQTAPDFMSTGRWVKILGKYVSFFGLLLGPFSISIYFFSEGYKRFKTVQLILFVASMVFGWFFSDELNEGELDFGAGFPFGVRAVRVLLTFGFVSAVLLFAVIFKKRQSIGTLHKSLLIGFLTYLVLISASRPTQRYLIYGIPIVLMFLVDALRNMSKKLQQIAVGSTALVFASVSLLGMSYLRAQGNASEQMAVWIEENGLINETSPGVIFPHSGQHFWGIEVKQIRYEVIAVTPEDELKVGEKVLHREPMNVLGKVTRVYLLREVSASP